MNLLKSIFHFSLALCVVAVAYGAYSTFAVPAIEGNAEAPRDVLHTVQHRQEPHGSNHSRTLIAKYLPENGWERSGCKILETQHGLVLFKEYELTNDNQIVVEPLTLIVGESKEEYLESTKQKHPVLLRTDSKAILFFEANEKSGTGLNFGNLVGGQLPGDVEITQRESAPGANDEIYLHVHNIQIDDTTIITPHDVHFRFGKSYGAVEICNCV